MSVRWSTLVAGNDGAIDMVRLRGTASVLLAMCGGVLMIVVTLASLLTSLTIDLTLYAMMVGATIVPLTGGKIADGLTGRSLSAKIVAGKAADRRGSGPQTPPETP